MTVFVHSDIILPDPPYPCRYRSDQEYEQDDECIDQGTHGSPALSDGKRQRFIHRANINALQARVALVRPHTFRSVHVYVHGTNVPFFYLCPILTFLDYWFGSAAFVGVFGKVQEYP